MKKFWSLVLMAVLAIGMLVGCSGGGQKASQTAATNKNEGEAKSEETATSAEEIKGTIKVGGLFDLTGGTGDVGTPYAEGEKAYFEYLATQGPVNGYKLELIGDDYAYKIPEATKLYQKLKSKDQVAAILGWGTGDTEALRQLVAADKLPFISASYSENLKNMDESPYNFLSAASYSDQARSALKWIKDNHTAGTPTVALLYNDTAFGKSPIEDAKDFAAEIGIEVVDEQIVDLKALDATPQLLNMEKKNPDYAIIQETWGATATILKDAKKLGIDTQFIGLNWATGEGLLPITGDAAEGFIGVVTHAFPYEDLPGLAEIKTFLESKGEKLEDKNQKFVQGWVAAKIMVEGIRLADDPTTGEGIRAGLEKITNLDLQGLAAPVTFSADNHAGTNQIRLAQVKDGKFEVITDYIGH
ncbi:ABC transporter substrate-binding protein [Schinkia azotoformans]|uniref:ABC transporter substrate-binding protein n=1 Tax=Schinkia azotoformans TaxID=1454 RepID=UPI002DBD6ED8|nr:ABC transporter substrate-binding protein [Schinkia azotoformans]MEC1715711.1 ABC transporter substrate-binding protein [Schinkia azotoformans]MEC1741350.1 ABC transporter substrate-binding protein [Schinkia azotoformans]MEC1744344.1 ABC transporter substrate-binding protein [Schinkia azotoformans]MEC1758665.1 ABC transporter substrate-binding protein [Schinkia azotoformans]MEC1765467.1 ABC transporter substrate-binding protein [Schinkia azotoformans]